jgi:myo-inositol-1(or 4)-monophosphatase
MGAASLDLAYVAAGRYDGFWEMNLKSWDIAAGILLIQEAGGFVSDFKGGNSMLESGNIVCGSPKVFKPLLQIVGKHMRDI